MKRHQPADGFEVEGMRQARKRRKKRVRGTPEWLLTASETDELAKRRCLAILSVLSGEKSVTEVIEEAAISRQTYYRLEEAGLRGMLASLAPAGEARQVGAQADAETRLQASERSRRRLERLLFLTRKIVKRGPMVTKSGRPRKRRHTHISILRGGTSSTGSKTSAPSSSSGTGSGSSSPEASGEEGL